MGEGFSVRKRISGLYFITDSTLTRQGVLEDVKQVLAAGCSVVQYREKQKSTAAMVVEAREIARLCRKKKALFLVNDRVDVALAAGADGVHIGQGDMPLALARKILGKKRVIGVTVHSAAEALQAQKSNADYVSVSPIFATATKSDAGPPVGVELIKKVKKKVALPVVAIGGINRENLQQVLQAGADSVAMISAIVCSESPGAEAKRIVGMAGGVK